MTKLFLPLLAIVMLGFSSCKKEYISTNTNNNETIPFYTNSSSWITSDGGYTFYTKLSVPEIDNYFNNYGSVLIYMSFDGGANYEQLPEVYDGISYTFQHTVGGIIVSVQSNTNYKIYNPGNTIIKVVLLNSN